MATNEVFSFINSIMTDTENKFSEDYVKRNYSPLLANSAFSYFKDTVPLVCIIARYRELPKYAHYLFLFHTINKTEKPRFIKWIKRERNEEDDIKAIMNNFSYNRKKALEVKSLFSDKEIFDMSDLGKDNNIRKY